MADKVPSVLACALSAWEHVCPERTDLLHRSYRPICRMLIEMDEWGQLVAMRVLSIYVRRCFNKPDESCPKSGDTQQFYDDSANDSASIDPDLQLLYKCALQLTHSRSSAVSPHRHLTNTDHYRADETFPRFSAAVLPSPHHPESNSTSSGPLTCRSLSRAFGHYRRRLPTSRTSISIAN